MPVIQRALKYLLLTATETAAGIRSTSSWLPPPPHAPASRVATPGSLSIDHSMLRVPNVYPGTSRWLGTCGSSRMLLHPAAGVCKLPPPSHYSSTHRLKALECINSSSLHRRCLPPTPVLSTFQVSHATLHSNGGRPAATPTACGLSNIPSRHSRGASTTPAALLQPSAALPADLPPLDPGLYVVATPIGNLEDITLRAIRVLKSVTTVLCEDTRHTRKLLLHYGIPTPTLSLHEHNEKARIELVVQRLQGGEPIALVSDAGVPGISDPGALLVAAAAAAGCAVIPIPGACAAVSALCASGLPTLGFHFVGFLPDKVTARQAAIAKVSGIPVTLVFYVPPHDLLPVLRDLAKGLGAARAACVARELTKRHETFHRGSLQECLDGFSPGGCWEQQLKGEIVLMVEGSPAATPTLLLTTEQDQILPATAGPPGSSSSSSSSPAALRQQLTDAARQQLLEGGSVADVTARLQAATGLKRNKVYSLVLQVRSKLVSEGLLT